MGSVRCWAHGSWQRPPPGLWQRPAALLPPGSYALPGAAPGGAAPPPGMPLAATATASPGGRARWASSAQQGRRGEAGGRPTYLERSHSRREAVLYQVGDALLQLLQPVRGHMDAHRRGPRLQGSARQQLAHQGFALGALA
jgi:hypothetical protein